MNSVALYIYIINVFLLSWFLCCENNCMLWFLLWIFLYSIVLQGRGDERCEKNLYMLEDKGLSRPVVY
jgi:hypothetical protein